MKRAHFTQNSLTVLILISLFFSTSLAYAEWTVTTFPNPNSDLSFRLQKIDFTDSNEGWALGSGSNLLHYSNGMWTASQLPEVGFVNRQLSDIQFISHSEGWAAGSIEEYSEGENPERGVLYHYVNGDWTTVSLPDISSKWYLSSIQFFSPNEGWVGGVDDVNKQIILLQYTNGGWKTNTIALRLRGESSPVKIVFTSTNEGWVIGTPGFILHYLDGKWEKTRISSSWQLRTVHFASPNEGWAVGTRPYGRLSKWLLLHYLNGRWRSIKPPKGSYWLNGVDFISPDEGWAVGATNSGNGILLHYLNGSWTVVDIPILDSSLGSYFSDVQFLSPSKGRIAGYKIEEHLAIGDRLSGLLLEFSSP